MEDLNFVLFETSLGWMGIAGSTRGLRKVILPQKTKEEALDQARRRHCLIAGSDNAAFGDLPWRLGQYLAGELVVFPDRLDLVGVSHFQQSVWRVTRTISYGETRSYAWVASQLSLPKASRAVGQALAGNPLPIVIPCHRVISSDGTLGGFSGGVEMKKLLLRLEHP